MNSLNAAERLALAESVSRLLDDLHGAGQPRRPVGEIWRLCADMGWPLALAPESRGGMELGMGEALAMAERYGRGLLEAPLSDAMVLAATIGVDEAGSDAAGAVAGHLRRWFAGDVCCAPIAADSRGEPLACYALPGSLGLALRHADGGLYGELYALRAPRHGIDPLIMTARPEAAPVQSQRLADCSEDAWRMLCLRRRAMSIAEILGAGRAALDLAVGHARERVQFGQPIGVNQAVKHTLAGDWMALDDAGLALQALGDALDRPGADVALPLAAAQLLAVEGAGRAAAHALQAHGAMGMTWECPVHFYLKRVRHLSALLGRSGGTARLLDEIWRAAA